MGLKGAALQVSCASGEAPGGFNASVSDGPGRVKDLRPAAPVALSRDPRIGSGAGFDPESSKIEYLNFLDPGSRPALRDLAGMTNCDPVSQAGKTLKNIILSTDYAA